MDTARWDLAGNIFEKLLGAPQSERTVLLDDLCAGDAELRRIVESMLDSENSALRFEDQLRKGAVVDADTTTDAVEPPEAHVGPWRLVRKLGSGGMGVVWLGERADGQFEQRSALKLIKRGMDSEAVLKRFLRERQILARLVHPHIAHLLDGGIAADGRPYFAMEYVEGLPLLRWCHEHGATLEQRIDLFKDVCAAVQFAHEHHVVHRDLKPSNILVTANGSVKLLDFGIAKLVEADDEGADAITHLQRERPMTPAYAAPEQIRGDRITETTDIYALGCVLYELLTGQRAHDFSGAQEPRDVLRIIEATDPVAPSRLKLAKSPVPLRRLRGDLDTIVLTALRREPARRYASVAALAADLKSFLTGQPISARGDSVWYRGWKYARRHRVGLAAIAMVAAIGIAALVFELRDRPVAPPKGASLAIVGFNNLSQTPDNAWLNSALAEMLATELATSYTVHVLPDELVRAAKADLPVPLAGGYAGQSLAMLRKRLGADFVLSGSYLVSGSAPDTRLRFDFALQDTRTGLARATLAESGALADLSGLIEKAGASLREKSGFAPAVLAAGQRTDKAQPPSTEVARSIGIALDALSNYDPARARDELLQAEVLAPGYAPIYMHLAKAWKALGFDARALAAAKQANMHAEGLPKAQQLQIARQVALQQSQWDEALKVDAQLRELDAKNPEYQLALVDDYLSAGNYKSAQAELEKAREILGPEDLQVAFHAMRVAEKSGDAKALEQQAELALKLADARDAPIIAARAKRSLGIALDQMGDHERAATLYGEAIAEFQRSGNPKEEAGARTSLAILLQSSNQTREARAEYQRALDVFQRIGDRAGIAAVSSNIARVLWDSGDHDGAEAAVRQVLVIRKETGDLGGQGWAMVSLAEIQLDDNASDDTLNMYRQALLLDEQGASRGQLLSAMTVYIGALGLRGDFDMALEFCTKARQLGIADSALELQCAAIELDRLGPSSAMAGIERAAALARADDEKETLSDIDQLLARIDMANREFDSARTKLDQVVAYFSLGEQAPRLGEARSMLAFSYASLGRSGPAQEAASQARELRSAITRRRSAAMIDYWLARAGATDVRTQAVSRLIEIADDAERRQWTAFELEARLAAIQLMDKKDRAALAQREKLQKTARARGFGWVLARSPDH